MKISICPAAGAQSICKLCGQSASKRIIDVKDAPTILGCATSDRADSYLNFGVYCCDHCGFISTDAQALDDSYEQVHSEALGPTWERHHNSLAQFCAPYITDKSRILEIGPSVSPLVRRLHKSYANAVFVDAIRDPPFPLQANEQFIAGYFPNGKVTGLFDVIIASHVFEHAPDMSSFLSSAAQMLSEKSHIFLSIPNFEIWIQRSYWSAITPEHNSYPFKSQLESLCNRLGLNLVLENFSDHSLFMHITKRADAQIAISTPTNAAEVSTEYLVKWAENINASISDVESKLASIATSPSCVCIAGASHLSQYPILISQIICDKVDHILDNSKTKTGRRLYGTSKTVHPFEFIATQTKPLVIIFTSPYQQEMIKQVEELNGDTIVICPASQT